MPGPPVILFGAGSDLIVDYEQVCLDLEIPIAAVVANRPEIPERSTGDWPVRSPDDLDDDDRRHGFVVPLFTPANRHQGVDEATSAGLTPHPSLIALNSDVPSRFSHGVGCFVNRRVVIGNVARLGDHVVVNRSASLGHHIDVADFASIGPGVVTGGNVTLGRGALVGTGAVILPTVTIGANAVVGAGAVVTRDVGERQVVVGNPAKVVKENDRGI